MNFITDKGHTEGWKSRVQPHPDVVLVDFSAGIQGSWEGHMAARTILGAVVPLHPHVISGKLCCLSEATFSSIKGCLELPKALLSSEDLLPAASLPASRATPTP